MNSLPTLHAATEVVRDLLDQIDPETGECPEGFEQARAVVATKATAVAAYILETERQADYVKGYAKELMDRARTAERRAEWLKRYLREHMAAVGITKISHERGLFSATLSPGRDKSVDVFDEGQLQADYWREIPATKAPDKTLIRKAMDAGFDVAGARLVAHDRLTIR